MLLRSQCSVCRGVAVPTEGAVRTDLSRVSVFNTVLLALPQTLLATRAMEALVSCEILAGSAVLWPTTSAGLGCVGCGDHVERLGEQRCRALQCQSLLDVLGSAVMHSPRRAGH